MQYFFFKCDHYNRDLCDELTALTDMGEEIPLIC